MDLNAAPKFFCDNVNIRFNDEYFLLQIQSGAASNVFAFSPAHIKRLALATRHFVAQFEKEHGVIRTDWTPDVPSPIQAKDILNISARRRRK